MWKRIKKIATIAACLWVLFGIIDFSRVHSYKRPFFCIWSMKYLDGGSGTYTGLGYSFEIKGDFIGENALGITEYTAKIFGNPVMKGIQGQQEQNILSELLDS